MFNYFVKEIIFPKHLKWFVCIILIFNCNFACCWPWNCNAMISEFCEVTNRNIPHCVVYPTPYFHPFWVQGSFSYNFSLSSSLNVRCHVLLPCNVKDEIIVWYISILKLLEGNREDKNVFEWIITWILYHFTTEIVLYCIVLMGDYSCPMHCDPFKIYCAPANLNIRTWICRLHFAQRPIVLGVRFFNEP